MVVGNTPIFGLLCLFTKHRDLILLGLTLRFVRLQCCLQPFQLFLVFAEELLQQMSTDKEHS